jgi:hypothetical protein
MYLKPFNSFKVREWFIPGSLIVLAWVYFYFPLISGTGFPGFRDSSHFYLPLYSWIASEIDGGHLPLWNMHEDMGLDVVGDASSAIFYPMKLVMHVPIGDYRFRFGWYIALHGLLAIINAAFAARTFGCSSFSATIAGLSFGLSGPVLFTSMNVIFLVGLAWLPMAVAFVWEIYRRPTIRKSMALSFCLCMMILGGDAQMAYHVVLIAGLLFFSRPVHLAKLLLKTKSRLNQHQSREKKRTWKSIWYFIIAFGSSISVSAIQIIPALCAVENSDRNEFTLPHNIYQLPEYFDQKNGTADDISKGFFSDPDEGTHHGNIYQFSQPPWTLAECVWPNVSGKPYPTQQRWVDAFPGADRVWNPSLYFGTVIVLFALFGKCRRRIYCLRWIWVSAVVFLTGSFGWYGIGWLIKELSVFVFGSAALEHVGSQVGGTYWLMATVLPVYSAFRYPAKLFAVAVLFLCLGGAIKLDSLHPKTTRNQKFVAFLIMQWLLLAVALGGYLAAFAFTMNGDATTLFGPLVHESVFPTLLLALSHSVVTTGAFIIALKMAKKCEWRKHRFRGFLLLIALVDLTVANNWLIPITNDSDNTRPATWLSKLEKEDGTSQKQIPRVYRVDSHDWRPENWYRKCDLNRLEEIQQWEFETLYARTGLLCECEIIGSYVSLQRQADQIFKSEIVQDKNSLPGFGHGPIASLWKLGTEFIICPTDSMASFSSEHLSLVYRGDGFEVWRFTYVQPRAWITESTVDTNIQNSARDQRDETDPKIQMHATTNNVVVKTFIKQPCLLVLAYRYSPNLIGYVRKRGSETWRPVQVSKEFGSLAAVDLQTGDYEIVVRCVHNPFRWGMWISIATVTVITIVSIIRRIDKHHRTKRAVKYSPIEESDQN